MLKDNTEIQDKLEEANIVELVFRWPDDDPAQHNNSKYRDLWVYRKDNRGIWRTQQVSAPNSLYKYELAQVIKDQEDDIYCSIHFLNKHN